MAPSPSASPALDPARAPVLGVAAVGVPPVDAEGEGDCEAEGEGDGEAELQAAWVKVLSSKLTSPLRASTRPATVAPVWTLIEVRARTVPAKLELVPSVAELPTTQKTSQAWAPPVRATELPAAVVSVDPA